ncbi:MAG: carbon-nitrogen hydrolase family protein [Hyphomicrobiaceae bacterium]
MPTATQERRFRAALVQMCTGRDVARNLVEMTKLIREAAAGGAQYVQTPEVSVLMERDRARLFVETRPEEGNPAIAHCQALARELGIWLHLGSMGVLVKPDKIANRSFLFSPEGRIAARYDKIHMFDVELPGGESYRESRNFEPGRKAVLADLPWGSLGLTICYDMRFPTLYRALAKSGAELIAVPSAFTVPTGQAHWHVLLRARAIETQCFVLAAAQVGAHECGRSTYGHSMIVSPWGEVLAEADGEKSTVIFADIDMQAVEEARKRIPSLRHDRPFEVTHA